MYKELGINDLYEEQETAAAHIIENASCGLFMSVGSGKTAASLTAFDKLKYDYLEINSALVVGTKKIVESVWKQEAERWSHLKHLKITRIVGSPKQRRMAIKKKSDLHLISRDNFAWLCGIFGGTKLPWDMIFYDESSSFKSHKSVRFKAARKIVPSVKRSVILTATPSSHSLLDLWAQIYLLDEGERLGKFFTNFRKDYFIPGWSGFSFELQNNAADAIHERISDICISLKSTNEVKEPVVSDIFVPLPSAVQKRYDDFQKDKVLEIIEEAKGSKADTINTLKEKIKKCKDEDELYDLETDLDHAERLNVENFITVTSAAGLSMKLLQFANGAVYNEEKDWHVEHDCKLDALVEFIDEAKDENILIARQFKHDLIRLQERLKKEFPWKVIKELKTDKDVVAWNAGEIDILITHPASGGHGLNLQFGGSILVWFGLNWALELYIQLNGRLARPGQDDLVRIYRLIATNTIDEKVVKSLAGKSDGQNKLLEAVKSEARKYIKNARPK